jgi:hypothetical protein
MDRLPIVSSNIKEAGFDTATNTLEIAFADGRIYQYFDVPENVFQELRNSASAGQYFHQSIRGTYRFARI